MGDWAVSQIIDAIRYAQSLLRNHAHAAGDGSRGINTDVIIKSRKRIGPPLEVQSRQMNLRLNAQFWGGHRVGDPIGLPFVIERFPSVAHRPAFGTQGRLVYIDSQDAIYLDIGTAWLGIAEEGAIAWDNILNKPTVFPPESHSADKVTSGIFDSARIPSHGAGKHTGSVIPAADQDFQEYQALAFRVENLAGLPAVGNKGRLVLLTTDNRVYWDDGSTWVAW